MQIAKGLAGFSPAEAETLRKAIGKKIHELMASLKDKFLQGCEANGVAATVAQGVHGRRRVGQGDSFWQFRRFVQGDPIARIDWRNS